MYRRNDFESERGDAIVEFVLVLTVVCVAFYLVLWLIAPSPKPEPTASVVTSTTVNQPPAPEINVTECATTYLAEASRYVRNAQLHQGVGDLTDAKTDLADGQRAFENAMTAVAQADTACPPIPPSG